MNFPYFLSIEVFISTLLMKFALENKEEKMWKMFLVFGGFAKKICIRYFSKQIVGLI